MCYTSIPNNYYYRVSDSNSSLSDSYTSMKDDFSIINVYVTIFSSHFLNKFSDNDGHRVKDSMIGWKGLYSNITDKKNKDTALKHYFPETF